jgi:nucleoside-diphosphate-sugar epimerase
LFLRKQRIEVVSGDLSWPQIASQCAKDADAIIHAAGQLGGWGTRESFIKNNVVATQNLLEAAVDHRVKQFVYVSSATSYGRQPGRSLAEDSPTHLEADPYCETKLRCEEIVRSYSSRYGLKATVLRPSIIFGPFDNRFLPVIVRRVKDGKMVLIGKSNQGPPMVYVTDVVDFVSAILDSQSTVFEIFNLSNPERVSWERITAEISSRLGVKARTYRIPYGAGYAVGGLMEFLWKAARASNPPMITRFVVSLIGLTYNFDSSRALSVDGFKGFTPFSVSLDETMERVITSGIA